jgi:ubiquinone/menaquinone biosynthesis C-methylase UbiE
MKDETVKGGWSGVDSAGDPSHFVRLMDKVRGADDSPEQYSFVREMLGVTEGQRILDVGCGTGGATRVLADVVGNSGRAVGVDSSETMLRVARERSKNLKLPIDFQLSDACKLPFPDSYFDRVFALRVFEIVENPAQVLREMFRVAKPGGRIFANGPDVDTWTFDVNDKATTRAFIHYFCDHEVNGWIGRQLPRMFAEMGGSSIKVSAQNYFSSDFDLVHQLFLQQSLNHAIVSQVIPEVPAKSWLVDLKSRCAAAPFAHSQEMFRIIGIKPL